MPADPSSKPSKRSLVSKRGAIACIRCKERKSKCVPAPPGTSNVPTCTNCFSSGAECIYLDRTPNELFLLEYVTQLESRIALLEVELSKYNPTSEFSLDHSKPIEAAVQSLTQQYPQGSYQLVVGNDGQTVVASASQVDTTKEEGDEDLALGIGMLSLSGSGEPLYVGASSGVNWARVCATALRRPRSQPSQLSRFSYLAPPELASLQSALSYTTNHPTPPLPPPKLANYYLQVVYTHIQARYGCFDWPAVRNWHDNRQEICQNRPILGAGRGEDQRRLLASFFLWLCYGYGARLTEDEKLDGAVSHEVYYNTAVACLSTLTSQHSLATVQALLLLTIYSFRHPRAELSIWQVGGLALRTAVELGLHRRTRSKAEREKDPLRYEMKKRVFWAVYTLDRMMALQLGRPSGIQDRDIDVELPLNIDVDYADAKAIFTMQNAQIDQSHGKRPGDEYESGYGSITSMTSSIHNVRLNQLKQDIQDAIYRLDMPIKRPGETPGERLPDIDALLIRLARWKSCHPILPPGRAGVPLLSKEQFDMEYHNCVQMMLRPVISSSKAARHYSLTLAESAASLCEYNLLQPIPDSPRLSTWALYRLFLSGLTLLHVSSQPIKMDRRRAAETLHKCQDTLGIFARSFPAAIGYEECFKELVAAWEARGQVVLEPQYGIGTTLISPLSLGIQSGPPQAQSQTSLNQNEGIYQSPEAMFFSFSPTITSNFDYSQYNSQQILNAGNGNIPYDFSASSLTGQYASTEAMPLLGSPASAEAFSDTWAGRLGEMGGRMGGGMRDDFFSLMSSFGLDTVLESVEETLPPVGEDEMWNNNDWDKVAAQTQPPSQFIQSGRGEWLGYGSSAT